MLPPAIRALIPPSLRARVRRIVEHARRRARRSKLASQEPVTRESLAADLREAGLREGDLVMVHSSLSGIGWLEGGPDAVIAALRDVVGPSGTLLFPIFPLDRHARDWLATDPLYDPRTTPSNLGAVSEAFRKREGVVFGDHATHPFAGEGPLAHEVLDAHGESVSPVGPRSAFAEVTRRGGRLLALGSPFTNVSAFHLVEEHPDFPERVFVDGVMRARVRRADASIVTRDVKVMDPELARRRFEVRPAWAARIEHECERRGAFTRHRAGRGTAFLFDAARFQDALLDMARQGITIYEPVGGGASAGASARSAHP
jgi:aminoglycoside 3-N-acetyltransferase